MANAISSAVTKYMRKQKRKRALAKTGSALKTAGKAVVVLGAVAGAAVGIKAAMNKRAEMKGLAPKKNSAKEKSLAASAVAATKSGANAIRARVQRGKTSR